MGRADPAQHGLIHQSTAVARPNPQGTDRAGPRVLDSLAHLARPTGPIKMVGCTQRPVRIGPLGTTRLARSKITIF